MYNRLWNTLRSYLLIDGHAVTTMRWVGEALIKGQRISLFSWSQPTKWSWHSKRLFLNFKLYNVQLKFYDSTAACSWTPLGLWMWWYSHHQAGSKLYFNLIWQGYCVKVTQCNEFLFEQCWSPQWAIWTLWRTMDNPSGRPVPSTITFTHNFLCGTNSEIEKNHLTYIWQGVKTKLMVFSLELRVDFMVRIVHNNN